MSDASHQPRLAYREQANHLDGTNTDNPRADALPFLMRPSTPPRRSAACTKLSLAGHHVGHTGGRQFLISSENVNVGQS